MLSGFTPPYTPSGRSALIPPPPWHYAGQLMSLAFRLDAARAQELLPEGLGTATGAGAAHFCEWQSTSDGSELLDPAYAQYREFIALVEDFVRLAEGGRIEEALRELTIQAVMMEGARRSAACGEVVHFAGLPRWPFAAS